MWLKLKKKVLEVWDMENILKAFGEWHWKVYLRQQFVCVSVFGDIWMDDFVVLVYLFIYFLEE